MKRTAAVLLATAAVALSGCSNDAPAGEAAPTSPATTTASIPATTVSTPSPVETPSEAPADGQTLNDRGNLTLKIGQEINPFDPGTATVVGTFTITGVGPSKCTVDSTPTNGKFVTVTMDAQGAPAADNPTGAPFYANSGGGVLTIVKADGTTWNGIPTTAECLDQAERLPAAIEAGEKQSASIALDVPVDADVLIYKPTLGLGYELNLN